MTIEGNKPYTGGNYLHPEGEKTTELYNWNISSKIGSAFMDAICDNAFVNSIKAMTETEEKDKMGEELNKISADIQNSKNSGVYNKQEMTGIQDRLVDLENKNFTLSPITRESVQVSINNLFNSITAHYTKCLDEGKVMDLTSHNLQSIPSK